MTDDLRQIVFDGMFGDLRLTVEADTSLISARDVLAIQRNAKRELLHRYWGTQAMRDDAKRWSVTQGTDGVLYVYPRVPVLTETEHAQD